MHILILLALIIYLFVVSLLSLNYVVVYVENIVTAKNKSTERWFSFWSSAFKMTCFVASAYILSKKDFKK